MKPVFTKESGGCPSSPQVIQGKDSDCSYISAYTQEVLSKSALNGQPEPEKGKCGHCEQPILASA